MSSIHGGEEEAEEGNETRRRKAVCSTNYRVRWRQSSLMAEGSCKTKSESKTVSLRKGMLCDLETDFSEKGLHIREYLLFYLHVCY